MTQLYIYFDVPYNCFHSTLDILKSMEEQNKQYSPLLQPLIIPISIPSSSSYILQDEVDQHNNYDTNKEKLLSSSISEHNIILRVILVFFVAIISLWANYEASKIFDITVVNDTKDSPAGRRFDLFYASNDKATRIVLNTSSFVENLLYPNNNNSKKNKKKHIASVTLRLARRNLNTTTTTVSITGSKGFNSYVIDISPMLLEDENFDNMAIVGAVQRAMAQVWLWDGGSRAPPGLLDGMVEYITELAGFRHESLSGGGGRLPECEDGGGRWWEDKNPRHVARLINYCENYKEGFIQRLNEAMRDTWHDRMVDDVLGIKSTKLCGLYNASWLNLI